MKAQDRRRFARTACRIRVEYSQPGAPLVARATATDISEGGLRALSLHQPPMRAGELLPMTLFLEDGPIKVVARLIGADPAGFAVEFENLGVPVRTRLDQLVRRAIAYRR